MWVKSSSPTWVKDPGSMCLMVLDDCTDQRAGDIPELGGQVKKTELNVMLLCVYNQGKFYGGIGDGENWYEGQLTLHKATYSSDMVIQQRGDPLFHDKVGNLWSKY